MKFSITWIELSIANIFLVCAGFLISYEINNNLIIAIILLIIGLILDIDVLRRYDIKLEATILNLNDAQTKLNKTMIETDRVRRAIEEESKNLEKIKIF